MNSIRLRTPVATMLPGSQSSIDNDTRGWIMCVVSGIACVIGASIICVDILIRLIPSKSNFKIQDSNVFLASSLSLSFGVMIFSSIFNILPSSERYLKRGRYSSTEARWIMEGCFVAGFVGIQIVSRLLHHYIPSHVVDCDHTHEDESHKDAHHPGKSSQTHGKTNETSPLLLSNAHANGHLAHTHEISSKARREGKSRRPSMVQVQRRVMSFVKDTKANCDSLGPCFGYTDPCGQECFKNTPSRTPSTSRYSTLARAVSAYPGQNNSTVLEENLGGQVRGRPSASNGPVENEISDPSRETGNYDIEAQHHHHVPENAFMSIGLQTSIAIALHKIPEGFLTYATNHANPSLGFSVFMALFIHNISEGFALALPLYLALQRRGWAMFWASLLGGATQPLGAAIAAAWFMVAGSEGHKPGTVVYGCMFGITAGIMTSVALQLFIESVSLNHKKNLSIGFGFLGMIIMATSNALTAKG